MERKNKVISIRVEEKMVDEISRLAKRCKTSPSDMARNLLDLGIGVTRDLERVGLLRVGLTLRDLHEWAKSEKQMKLPINGEGKA